MAPNGYLKRSYRLAAEMTSFRPARLSNLSNISFRGLFPEELLKLIVGEDLGKEDARTFQSRLESSNAATGAELSLASVPFEAHFHCGPFDGATVLSKDPRVIVEMRQDGVVRGIATVPLSPLLNSETFETWASLFALEEKTKEIGEILIRIRLEDLGTQRLNQGQCTRVATDTAPPDSETTLREVRLRQEIRASMEQELENWKREESEKHLRRMTQTETERMDFLESEWRRHEQQREKEMQQLRTKLHEQTQKATTVLNEVEERDRKVLVLQESLIRRRKDLERQHAAKLRETEDTIVRLQGDFSHHLSVEREKTQEALGKGAQLKQQLRSMEAESEKRERELTQLRKSNVQSQVLVLEEELNAFRALHKAAQERIRTLEDEKDKYKARVVELARQLAGSQRPAAKRVNQAQIRKIPSPVPPPAERETAFAELKAEFERLNLQAKERDVAAPVQTTQPALRQEGVLGPQDEEIEQMLRTRRELIETGVYHEQDALIVELDQRIRGRVNDSTQADHL